LARWRALAWRCYREHIGGYTPDACPAIAAWISSHGRLRLLEAIRCAGWSQVLYCDTDSVMVTEGGARRLEEGGLIREGEWGALYLKTVCADLELYGPKHYREGERVVCAGGREIQRLLPPGRVPTIELEEW
jgi:hypothetical protein